MAADPLTDPTPVPAGSWLVITLRPSIAGMLNLFQSVAGAVGSWIDYAPTTWAVDSHPVLAPNWFYGDVASIDIRVSADTTVGAVGTLANNVSNQLSVSNVKLIGPNRPDATDLSTPDVTCNGTADFLANPGACTWRALKTPLILAVIVFLGWLAYEAGLFGKAAKVAEEIVKPAPKKRGKRVAAKA